ncbi:MAG: hypothetical protein IPI46_13840 [Bacteroidetes bacterium]|nr:hypothetical protein [Bacteroidota bacterium]
MKKVVVLMVVFFFVNPYFGITQKFGFNIYDSLWLSSFLSNMITLEGNEFSTNYNYYNNKADSIISRIEREVLNSKFRFQEYEVVTGKTLRYDYHNYLELVERRLTCIDCFEQPKVELKYIKNTPATREVYTQLKLMQKYVNEDIYIKDEHTYSILYQTIQDSMNMLNPSDRIDAYLSFYEIVMEQNGPPIEQEWPSEFYYLRPHKQFILTEYYNFLMGTAQEISDIESKINAYLNISDFYFKHDLSLKSLQVLFEASTFIELQQENNLFLREKIMLKLYEILQSSRRYDKIAITIIFNEFIRTGLPQKLTTPGAITEANLTDENFYTFFNVAKIWLSEDWGDSSNQISAVPLALKYWTIYLYREDSLGDASEEIMNLFLGMGREKAKRFPFDKSIFYENRLFQRVIKSGGDIHKSLQEYCFIQILQNNWSKATKVLKKHSTEYKSINSLTFLLGVLNRRVQDPKFVKDKKGFFNFMETVYEIGTNKNIKKSNENAYMANYYFLLHEYYRNVIPFTSNLSDSVMKYGYLGYILHPQYQENIPDLLSQIYWRGDSSLSLKEITTSLTKLNNQLTAKRDSLLKEYIKINNEYEISVDDNEFLKLSNNNFTQLNKILKNKNKNLGIENERLVSNVNDMTRDTIRLGLQILAMSSSINKLKSDTALLNLEIQKKNGLISALNTEIKTKTTIGGTIIGLFAIALIPLALTIRKLKRRKSILEKEVEGMETTIIANKRLHTIQLAVKNLDDHDIDNAYHALENQSITSLKEKSGLAFNDFVQRISIINRYAIKNRMYKKKLTHTIETNYTTTLQEELNTILSYIPLYIGLYKNEVKNIQVKHDVPLQLLDILLPYKMIHNFVLNSIKHGMKGRTELQVHIKATTMNEKIIFEISDNGVGLKNIIVNEKASGLIMIDELKTMYNEDTTMEYTIVFDMNSDIQNNEKGGVSVTFKLLKK